MPEPSPTSPAPWCRLSILTDEVSQEPAEVIRFAREFGLDGVELRSLHGLAFKDLTPAHLADFGCQCREAGLAVSGVATPVFKCDLDSPAEIAAHLDLFRRSVEAAVALGCRVVRIFTFMRRAHPTQPEDLARAAEQIAMLLPLAAEAGVLVGVENEASCLAGDGAEMQALLAHLPPSPALGVVWDPCNCLYLDGASDPVRDDYPRLAGRVAHFHAKDARRAGHAAATACVELGTGQVDFPAQFAALRADGYRGWITLETHWRGAASRLDAASQHLPAGHAFTAGAAAASRICLARLQSLLAATEPLALPRLPV